MYSCFSSPIWKFLVVSLGNSRESTPTISKTLNPDWNVTFELPISGVPLLECVCWDRDRFGRDYMGEFDIPLEEIFGEGEIQHQVHTICLNPQTENASRG